MHNMLTSTSGMNLTITLTPSEALALRDALALSGRRPDYNFTLDPLWSEIGDYIYNLCQRGVLPGDVF